MVLVWQQFKQGIPKRIVIVDVTKEDEKKKLHCLINPKIKKFSDDRSSYEEGCLSIPNTFIQIERPREIEIEYIDENGKKKIMQCSGLLSTCIQHEVQHCDGILIIDYLSKLKKDLIIKKISKEVSNNNKIRKIGWHPKIKINQGIKKYVKWFKSN